MSVRAINPRRYHETVEPAMGTVADADPVCLYLETTNRCNLLCTTCPRTFVELEPPADMSWELFTSIVEQVPNLQRAVLHGVGEPMLVKNLPRMVRYLKERGVWANEPVPMFAYPSSPSYLQRWGSPDDHAWERAHHEYLLEFAAFSDIQETQPRPLEDLEAEVHNG